MLVHPGPPKSDPLPPAQEKTTLMISQPAQGLHFRLVLLDLGANITKLIVAKGKTPEDVALAVGIDIPSIYQIMTGRETDVSIKALSDIADFLGATFIPHLVLPDVPPAAV